MPPRPLPPAIVRRTVAFRRPGARLARRVVTCACAACGALTVLAACTASPRAPEEAARRSPADSAFAAVQARGADPRAMGVDQYTSVHRFDALPDGGRIVLQREAPDSAGVAQVRGHLRQIATAFAAGDFRTPAFVHAREVPGTAVMAAARDVIAYGYHDLPLGGEVRITTRAPEAVRAVHAFLAFQRADHRAGGSADPHAGHAGRAPSPGHHP